MSITVKFDAGPGYTPSHLKALLVRASDDYAWSGSAYVSLDSVTLGTACIAATQIGSTGIYRATASGADATVEHDVFWWDAASPTWANRLPTEGPGCEPTPATQALLGAVYLAQQAERLSGGGGLTSDQAAQLAAAATHTDAETILTAIGTSGGSYPSTSDIASAVFGTTVEGFTFTQLVSLMASVLLGKSSNGGATFRDVQDTKNSVVATVDSGSNRTAVTLNP